APLLRKLVALELHKIIGDSIEQNVVGIELHDRLLTRTDKRRVLQRNACSAPGIVQCHLSPIPSLGHGSCPDHFSSWRLFASQFSRSSSVVFAEHERTVAAQQYDDLAVGSSP